MRVVLGLTGISGSGKSAAGRLFEKYGCRVIDCDQLSRRAQKKGEPCYAELVREFGAGILAEGGEIDRRRLGRLCFGDPQMMKRLNSVCHKHILKRLEAEIASAPAGVCVVEAGALYESGADSLCDCIAAVIADRETALSRITRRDGISETEAAKRLDSQLSPEELAARADYVIFNQKSIQNLEAQIADLVNGLKIKYSLEDTMDKEKTAAEQLSEKLLLERKSAFKMMSGTDKANAAALAKRYMKFISAAKTERECVNEALKLLDQSGYTEFDCKKSYKPGDKVYLNNRGKALIAAVVGSEKLESGIRVVASHTDSPRLDLKPYPLYEDSDIAFFKTHYYGGIKKYQWTNIPLAIHGVVVAADGTSVEVCIGEDDEDPVFYITNLLPHLSASHSKRTAREVIKGEELNIVIGSEPFDDDKVKEAVKLNAMKLINEKYGFVEKDFISAELEIVPAFKARYIGFDRSFIGAYGHDDRVCAYPSLEALLALENSKNTCLCIFADKEETGSDGCTGMNSDGLKNFITQLAGCVDPSADPIVVIQNSCCLSTDVTAALDPTFSDVSDRRNASFINYGVSVDKYGGSGGKGGCNDASAEYMGRIKKMLDDKGICWQTGELGKVDEGGGGTVAKYISALGMDTVDCGVPLLSMHSPFELASVLDIYSFYQCCHEFFKM